MIMGSYSIRVDDIEIGKRHRALSDDAVKRLAASLKDIGLRQPISVRIVDEMLVAGELTAGVPVLVAGAHRLAAAKLLGWDRIDCLEVEDDPISAEMWELAENLHRMDLTKEQRDEHIRRYAELLEARREVQSRQNVAIESKRDDGRGHRPEGVAAQIAKDTGLSKRTVERALNPKPAPEPKAPLADYDVVTVQFNALMAAWNRAGIEAREMFLENIDGPVFDRTRAA